MKPADILAALAVTLIWGLNFAVGKVGVGQFPPLLMTAIRFSLVALALIWFVPRPAGRMAQVALLSVTFGSLHFGLTFVGLSGVDAAAAAIVMQLTVPFGVLLAWLVLGDRFGGRRTLGLVIAFSGVVILAGEPAGESGQFHLALLVAAAFAWGVANIQIKKIGRINVFALNAWMGLFAAPQLILASALLESGQLAAMENADWMGWGAILYMVLGGSITAYGMWYYLIEKYEVSRILPFTFLAPVIGVAAGIGLLGEALTWEKAAGGLITMLGVAVIQLRWRRPAGPAA